MERDTGARGGAGRLCRVLVVVVLAAASLSACSRGDSTRENLLQVIQATKPLARTFSYTDRALGANELKVVGVVEDAYRYRARLSISGDPVHEEIGVDDALAVRFLDASKLGFFLDPQALAQAQARAAEPVKPRPGQVSVTDIPMDALQANRWVVDPVGAPSLVVSAAEPPVPGADPVFDALTALDYVERVVRGAENIVKFNKEALSPTYEPEEDDFPKPDRGAPVTRYDVPLRKFPRAATAASGNTNQEALVPTPENFRKMAIYVKDGRVIEVREHIDVPSRIDDLKRAFGIEAEIDATQAVTAINEVRKERGQKEVFRARRMQLVFETFGEVEPVALPPAGQFVPGNLAILRGRGRLEPKRNIVQTSGGAPAAGSSPAEASPASASGSTAGTANGAPDAP